VIRAKNIITLAGVSLMILAGGCSLCAPRPRIGTLPVPPPRSRYGNPNDIGKHSYHFNPLEKNCIIYTCKGGHIDISHVRWNADHTRYLADRTRQALMKGNKGFTFTLPLEISEHIVRFSYPQGWEELAPEEKEKIVNEISKSTGAYLAFNATLWHEILTWFGVHFVGFEPEFSSSFSWEDIYSNVIGTELAIKALEDTELDYDTAMTLALDRELSELGALPRKTAIKATEKMRGEWFTGHFLINTLKKNLDVGLDDGFVTPVLIGGICENQEPDPRAVPTTDILSKYGFSIVYEISPREWEKGKILRVVYGKQKGKKKARTIQVDKHFPIFIEHIKKQAVEKYGYTID